MELFDRGLSRSGRGGSLTTYVSNIGHLVRFCFKRRVDFHDLTDGQFSTFIHSLRKQGADIGQPVRSDSHTLAIGNHCLDFLEFIALDREEPNLLGRQGKIKAYRETIHRTRERHKYKSKWCHSSLPSPAPLHRRYPISANAINALREAVLPTSTSMEQRRRRYAMLRVLEMTGGRRIEVANLSIADVARAISTSPHMLRMMTAKRRGGKEAYREIPVAKADLLELWNFIQTSRRAVIRRTVGLEKDHGKFFINERTGMPLRPNTITQEIHILSQHAGLKNSASPHLFRHRFITKMFVALIEQHDFESPSDLRRAIISVKDIKQQLQQWTGHLSLSSLDRYIDLAFSEIEQVGTNRSVIDLHAELEALRAAVNRIGSSSLETSPDLAAQLLALANEKILPKTPK
ncbi:site-specific integrase [Comamonas terrigena]|nr:site-specific integrase [Comamonas terrigena]